MPEPYIKKILRARVYDVAHETPLDKASRLSGRLNNRVFLKREDLQPVFSFKIRGAYNCMFLLSQSDNPPAGVIAASAGNHAQGVALSAQTLNMKATIVMPETTPRIKVQAVHQLQATVILFGDTYDDAYQHAQKLAKLRHLAFIHPYDDPDVIAGQGTVAMEVLRQHSEDIEAIFVPVGGGGLIAGIAAYLRCIRPGVRIIGVEPEDSPCLQKALAADERVILDQVGLFADGVAVKQIGEEPFRIARCCVDEVILVNADELCAAIKDIFDDTRSIAEPAGALAVAGLKKYVEANDCQDKSLVAIVSGANVNFDRLRHIAERAELGERRETLLAVTIPETPGSFLKFCQLLGKRGITEFNYRYSSHQDAHVFVGLQMQQGHEERDLVMDRLQGAGYAVLDMTDNEMGKLHIRHLVGGHSREVADEQLYRFEFPERPGALLYFLQSMGERWNISLFHYRNHGADYGRVLVGIQVPDRDKKPFMHFLQALGYTYYRETDNPASALFLKSGG